MFSLNSIILGNTLLNYFYAFGLFVFLSILFKIFQLYLLRRLRKIAEKTKTDIDDTFIEIIQSLRPSVYYFISFYFATYSIHISGLFKKVLEGTLLFLIVYQVIFAAQILINYLIEKKIARNDGAETDNTLITIGKIAKIILWGLGLLLILSNFGINITSLIAGLGIGGVAIAFALQNILADLFSSFAIYFDKPFRVGDFIKIGQDMGIVEKIGIKTTRLKTPQGEELIVSNQELTSARIQNFKQMDERRGLFSLGVVYDTSLEKLKIIPETVKIIIESINNIRFDRAHFKDFGDSSLNFEIVYYIDTNDYNEFMNAQQEINLKIFEKFKEDGIELAFPTQTIYTKSLN